MTVSVLSHQVYAGMIATYDHHPFDSVIGIATTDALSNIAGIVAAPPRGVFDPLRIIEKRVHGLDARSNGLIGLVTGDDAQKLWEAQDDRPQRTAALISSTSWRPRSRSRCASMSRCARWIIVRP